MGIHSKRACAALTLVLALGAGACEGGGDCTLVGCSEGLDFHGTIPIRAALLANLDPSLEVCHQDRCITAPISVHSTATSDVFEAYVPRSGAASPLVPDPSIGFIFGASGEHEESLRIWLNVFPDRALMRDGDRYSLRLYADDGRLIYELVELVERYQDVYPNGEQCDAGCRVRRVDRVELGRAPMPDCEALPIDLGELPAFSDEPGADPGRSALDARFVVQLEGRRLEAAQCNPRASGGGGTAKLVTRGRDWDVELHCVSEELSVSVKHAPEVGAWTDPDEAYAAARWRASFVARSGELAGRSWPGASVEGDAHEIAVRASDPETRYEEGSLRYELQGGRLCIAGHWRGRLADCREEPDPSCGEVP